MHLFLKRFSYFILPLIIFFCILEFLLFRSDFSYSVQKKQFEQRVDSIEILILGPSYSYIGLNPGLFSHSAFNLSNNSQDIYYDYMLFQKYEKDLKRLRIVVFNIGYQTLDHELNSGTLEGRRRQSFYKRYYSIPRKDSKSFPVDYSLFLSMGFRPAIEHLQSKTYRNIENGWMINNDTIIFSEIVDDPEANLRQKISVRDKINSVLTDQNIEYLNQAIELCKERDIKILLCLDPVTSYYRKNINKLKYSYIVETLEKISDNRHVYFLNLFNDTIFCDTDFADMHHVNSSGSVEFSLSVNEMVERMIGPKPDQK